MKQILVVNARWVFVGDVADNVDEVTVTNAYNIRRWGTTKGLGQLAIHGPTSTTVLDECTTVVIPKSQILCRLHVVNPQNWPQT